MWRNLFKSHLNVNRNSRNNSRHVSFQSCHCEAFALWQSRVRAVRFAADETAAHFLVIQVRSWPSIPPQQLLFTERSAMSLGLMPNYAMRNPGDMMAFCSYMYCLTGRIKPRGSASSRPFCHGSNSTSVAVLLPVVPAVEQRGDERAGCVERNPQFQTVQAPDHLAVADLFHRASHTPFVHIPAVLVGAGSQNGMPQQSPAVLAAGYVQSCQLKTKYDTPKAYSL